MELLPGFDFVTLQRFKQPATDEARQGTKQDALFLVAVVQPENTREPTTIAANHSIVSLLCILSYLVSGLVFLWSEEKESM